MYKSVVYEGDKLLGEVEVYPQNGLVFGAVKEIRISNYSQPSERCPPLAVLHTITSSGVCLKMEESSSSKSKSSHSSESLLVLLHSSCLKGNKTAVVLFGSEELHLVAMYSRKNDRRFPCFWGFSVMSGLYNSCLVMLNLRCLGIVFDLDETLIVANTMRSFEDRIDALERKIASETDPQRVGGMMAEVKRYQDDKIILKQYAENDQVDENGKVIKSQYEVVPALSDNHQPIIRPLVRLQDRNIILTRINPMIRDTSVLVRLRPAWDDLRSYLTARGRKRFEVYVCTMAERDYALEMWRLLDPVSSLISGRQLLDRIVCVKSGSRKSLFNVFQDGNCHPKMALVIDDRLKVWDEEDQSRVHVVPAFAPYYAPLAEANNTTPILCLARNVACNARGCFFKEFDEGLLQRTSEVAYEDDIKDIPYPPDVSNYLISEDDTSALNGNKDLLAFDGLADGEVERRLKDAVSASSTVPLTLTIPDTRLDSSLQFTASSSSILMPQQTLQMPITTSSNKQLPQVASLVKPLSHVGPPEASLQSSPAREEGEVPESELDPDTRRRLLILQHGQDTRDHAPTPSESQFPARAPMQVSVPRGQMCERWFSMVEEMSPRHLNRVLPTKEFPISSEPVHIEKHQSHYPSFIPEVELSVPSDRVIESKRMPKAAFQRDVRLRFDDSPPSTHSFSGEEPQLVEPSSGNRELEYEPGQVDADTLAVVLQDIAFKCGAKVEFRPALVSSMDLQFSVQVWFGGEKIGEGIGRTRREAQHQAAEGSLMNLADKYLSHLKPNSIPVQVDGRRIPNESGFVSDVNTFRYQLIPKEESMLSSTSEPPKVLYPRLDNLKRLMGSVSALEELCMMQGLEVVFQPQPQLSANSGQKNEVYAQVEIDGQVLGKGVGLTWDEAKTQAAEKALGSLKSMLGQFSHKRKGSLGTFQGMSSKHLKTEFSGGMQRLPSARYPKNTSVP